MGHPSTAGRNATARWLDAAGFAGICMIWGTTLFAIKLGLRGGWSPLWFASIRFVGAGVLMAPVPMMRVAGPPLGAAGRRAVLPVAVVGIAVNFALVFWGEQFIGAGVASLIAGTQPATTMLIEYVVVRRRISARFVAGLVVGGAGVALIIGSVSLHSARALVGVVAVFIGITIYAGSTVYSVHRLPGYPLARVILMENAVGGVALAAFALAFEGLPRLPTSASAWLALGYLAAVASVAGLVGALWLMRRLGAQRFSLTSYVTPFIGALVSIVWLGESFRWSVVLGGALLLTALILTLGERAGGRSAVT